MSSRRRDRQTRRLITRLVSGVLASWGVALLARPEQLVRVVSPDRPEPHSWVVRLLGARMLLQHGLEVALPKRPLVITSTVVDGIHALSMLVMAATIPSHRRVTLVSAGIAGAATAVGAVSAPQADSR